jgi:hypothetical protein
LSIEKNLLTYHSRHIHVFCDNPLRSEFTETWESEVIADDMTLNDLGEIDVLDVEVPVMHEIEVMDKIANALRNLTREKICL